MYEPLNNVYSAQEFPIPWMKRRPILLTRQGFSCEVDCGVSRDNTLSRAQWPFHISGGGWLIQIRALSSLNLAATISGEIKMASGLSLFCYIFKIRKLVLEKDSALNEW